MGNRTVHGTLGIFCAVGLAVIGIGWHTEENARSADSMQRLVYCDIDSLARYHPAWKQADQIRAMLQSKRRDVVEQVRIPIEEPAWIGDDPMIPSPPRDILRTHLEERSQKEMEKVSAQLDASIERQISQKCQEIDARLATEDAEASRRSEQQLAKDLRTLQENDRFEQVNNAIKLTALQAQLLVPGIDVSEVKAAIYIRQTNLAGISSGLTKGEEEIRSKASVELAGVSAERRKAADKEIADLKDRESRRLAELSQGRRERLRQELDLDWTGNSALDETGLFETSHLRANAGMKAGRMQSLAGSKFAGAAGLSSGDMAAYEMALRARARTELKAIVKRIARDKEVSVIFDSSKRADDRTKWFREHLPYREL